MSYTKKHNGNTPSWKSERYRQPVSTTFSSEGSVKMTPSTSRTSLSSLTYETYSSTDSEFVRSNMSLQDLKAKFDELSLKKNNLQIILYQKEKEAIELIKEEFSLTGVVPSDHKLLDPNDEVCFTQNPLRSCLLNVENQSNYQCEKNRLLLQIETLTNILEVLRKTPNSEKKLKKELAKKRNEINEIKNKLNSLERGHVLEGVPLKIRSSSVGNLNRISSKVVEETYHNGNLSNHDKNHFDNRPRYKVPLTVPSQRKFSNSERLLNVNTNSNIDTSPDINEQSKKSVPQRSPYTIRNLKQSCNGNLLSPNSPNIKNSNFQRFASTRTTIKGPLFLEKFRSSFNKVDKRDIFFDEHSSSRSSASRSSIDDGINSDMCDSSKLNIQIKSNDSVEVTPVSDPFNKKNDTIFNMFDKKEFQNTERKVNNFSDDSLSDISDMNSSITSKTSIKPTQAITNKFTALRLNSKIVSSEHNSRDSLELNHSRLRHVDSYSQMIVSKSNNQNRNSVSLEDLRDDIEATSFKYLACREQKHSAEHVFSPVRNIIKYHPSIKHGKPSNLTKGKLPSIRRKEATNNLSSKLS